MSQNFAIFEFHDNTLQPEEEGRERWYFIMTEHEHIRLHKCTISWMEGKRSWHYHKDVGDLTHLQRVEISRWTSSVVGEFLLSSILKKRKTEKGRKRERERFGLGSVSTVQLKGHLKQRDLKKKSSKRKFSNSTLNGETLLGRFLQWFLQQCHPQFCKQSRASRAQLLCN